MTRLALTLELAKAADAIADVSRGDLQILLRRAALRLRNVEGLTLDADVEEAIDFLAAEMKPAAVRSPSDDHPRLADQRRPVARRSA